MQHHTYAMGEIGSLCSTPAFETSSSPFSVADYPAHIYCEPGGVAQSRISFLAR